MASPKKPERHFQITNNNAIDMHVGKRLRLRRTLLGMSQEQLGTELNITFQQVQKYERAANRISASRLWDMSQILDVPISYFFDDMSETTMQSSAQQCFSRTCSAEHKGFQIIRSPGMSPFVIRQACPRTFCG